MHTTQFISSAFLFVGLLLGSCGLKYTPAPSLEELEKTRRERLVNQLTTDFAVIGKKYSSLTFGESAVVKPLSYQRLDSLFEVKYLRSQNRLPSTDLDPLIENQRMILLSDTTEVLFMETNWMELLSDTAAEYLIAHCYLNNKNVLRKMEIVSQFSTNKNNQEWARKYMKEDWFVRDLGYTTQEESNFYTRMKNMEFELSNSDRVIFLENVFRVMRIANANKSLQAQGICIKLAAEDFKQSFPEFVVTDYVFSFKKETDATSKTEWYVVEATSEKEPNRIYLQKYDTYFIPQF